MDYLLTPACTPSRLALLQYQVFYGALLPNCSSPRREGDAATPQPSSSDEDRTTDEHDQDQYDLSEESYESLGFFKPSFQPERANMLYYITLAKKFGGRWMERVNATRNRQPDTADESEVVRSFSTGVSTYTPAFIPGRVLHIEVDKKAR